MKKNNVIQKLKEAYKNYCKKEWDEEDQIEENNILNVLYTTVNDEEYDVQVAYNIETEQLITSISDESNEYIFKEKYSIEDMITDLENGDWDGWYSYAHDVCDERFSLDLEW